MGTKALKQYDPRDHIQQVDTAPRSDDVFDQREITIQSYQTDLAFDYGQIDAGLSGAWLTPALRFGVFGRSPNVSKTECGVVLGLQDKQSVRAYDYDARRPIWYNWMDVVVDTVSVSYFKDDDGLLRFTTMGGGRRIGEEKLEAFNNQFLGIPAGAVTKRQFDLSRLRDLCFGRYVDRLYMVRFAGPSGEEYKSIDHALFQSKKYIRSDTDRLKEVECDKKVRIECFESDISLRSEELSEEIQVRFLIKGTSGSLRLKFPKLTYARQAATHDEQAAVFYRIVDKAVSAILDENYYTSTVNNLNDLDTGMELFPEMVDLAPYRKVLKAGTNRQKFFNTLDLGAEWKTWHPHLRALDELVASDAIAEDMGCTLRNTVKRDPREIVRLISVCRSEAKLQRIGGLAVRATAQELYGLPADVRGTVETELLAWAIKHETDAWRVDLEAGEIAVYNLQWKASDLSLELQHAVLLKLVGLLHKRLISAKPTDNTDSLSQQLNWCLTAAKNFPANFDALHTAFRLVVEDKVPFTFSGSNKILKEPANDWAELDIAMRDQFGLPLWPCFEATRQGKKIALTNTGVGAALSASVKPRGEGITEDDTLIIGDFLPRNATTITLPSHIEELEIRYLKFGEERTFAVPIRNAKAPEMSTVTPGPDYGWAKQAELMRAMTDVLADDHKDKSSLSRAIQKGSLKSNGKSGHACLVDVDSFKVWIAKDRGLQNDEVRQLENAIIGEIRNRKE